MSNEVGEPGPVDRQSETANEMPGSRLPEADGSELDPSPVVADPVLLASRSAARAALEEITDAKSIGADEGYEAHEPHVLTLFFACNLPGYPGWRWAATVARVDEESPVTVLEVELLPGEGAVIAPEWVPWSVRLSQYRESQARQAAEEAAAAEAAAAELAEEDDVDPENDLLQNDYSDFDDIDGVDFESDDDDDDDSDDDNDDLDDADDDLEDEEHDDSDFDDDDDDAEADDEDGFLDLDEHDLHDHPDDEVDFEDDEE